jgi:hypothetical protein
MCSYDIREVPDVVRCLGLECRAPSEGVAVYALNEENLGVYSAGDPRNHYPIFG